MDQQYRLGKLLLKLVIYTIIIWDFVPCFSAYMPAIVRYAIIIFLFMGSFLSSIMVNPLKQHFIRKSMLLIGIVVFLLLMYMGKWRYQGTDFVSYFCTAYLFWVPVLIFDVVSFLPENDIKRIRSVLLICIAVTMITTIIGSSVYSEASRLLSQGYNTQMDEIFAKSNIGGYGFIYGIVLLLPMILYLCSVVKNRILIFAFVAGSVLVVIYAQYSIALVLIVTIFIAYFVLKSGNLKRTLFYCLLGIVVFVLLRGVLIAILGFIQQESLNSGFAFISDRISLIIKILDGSGLQGDAIARQNLYLRSWNAFLEDPLIGSLFEQHQLGRHSELLDILGATGIVGLSLFFTMWYRNTKQIFSEINYIQKVYYFIACLALGVIFYLNTIFTSPEISVVMFIVPMLIFRTDSFVSNINEEMQN